MKLMEGEEKGSGAPVYATQDAYNQLKKQLEELQQLTRQQQEKLSEKISLEKIIEERVTQRIEEQQKRRDEVLARAKQQVEEASQNAEWERMTLEKDRFKTKKEWTESREAEYRRLCDEYVRMIDNSHYPHSLFMSHNRDPNAEVLRKRYFALKTFGVEKMLEILKRKSLNDQL